MKNQLTFTHKGWFCGIVPVYLNMNDKECPLIIERHWIFGPLFVMTEWVFGFCILIRTFVDKEYDPMFPIKITGEL